MKSEKEMLLSDNVLCGMLIAYSEQMIQRANLEQIEEEQALRILNKCWSLLEDGSLDAADELYAILEHNLYQQWNRRYEEKMDSKTYDVWNFLWRSVEYLIRTLYMNAGGEVYLPPMLREYSRADAIDLLKIMNETGSIEKEVIDKTMQKPFLQDIFLKI